MLLSHTSEGDPRSCHAGRPRDPDFFWDAVSVWAGFWACFFEMGL